MNIEIILSALFGATIEDADAIRLLAMTDRVFRGMTERVWAFFLPPWVPTPGGRAYRRAIAALDQEVFAIIRERRASATAGDDLLAVLLSAQDDETGERMSDQQLRDEVFTLFLAGYESTATSVTWTCYLLSRHGEEMARLRKELDTVLAGRRPTLDDLSRLPTRNGS